MTYKAHTISLLKPMKPAGDDSGMFHATVLVKGPLWPAAIEPFIALGPTAEAAQEKAIKKAQKAIDDGISTNG